MHINRTLEIIYTCQQPQDTNALKTETILDKKVRDHEFEQNFRNKFDMTTIFYFYISDDSFGHHLSQIRFFFLPKATTELSSVEYDDLLKSVFQNQYLLF